MPRQLGPGGTQLPRHVDPPGPKMGGDPYACDTGAIFHGCFGLETKVLKSLNLINV